MRSLAIIPARGGSKRIPKKNIKNFSGKPMIAWPIEAAKGAGLFERIIVSTDCDEIAGIAEHYGAEVPFMRPAELADDFTGTEEVVLHALDWLAEHGKLPEYVCCIYPTAPFLLPEDLIKGAQLIQSGNAPSVLSVCTFSYPVWRAFKQLEDASLSYQWPEYEHYRSQDLVELCHDAGQFYWLRKSSFLESKQIVMDGSLPVFLPRSRVQDIDTLEDWQNAELMAIAHSSNSIRGDF